MERVDKAYGILPLRRSRGGWEILVVKHQKGHWAFPKGHPHGDETPVETAIRELKEETALEVIQFLDLEPFDENYVFQHAEGAVSKTVTYFAAEVSGSISVQVDEIAACKWLPLHKAEEQITFSESKRICHALLIVLKRELH